MGIESLEFMKSIIRMCGDGWLFGWHERNAGNLSYRMTSREVSLCAPFFRDDASWIPMEVEAQEIAGSFLVVSGSGCLMRDAKEYPSKVFGIVQISHAGKECRVVWGLDDGKLTSEFPTHIIAHEARMKATDGKSRVVYHAHCPNVIALSNILPPDSRTWTKTLWKTMTEAILFFPEGLGVVPWMVPGGSEIAVASGGMLADHAACVWTQHGLFATGDDCDSAFGLAHMIEKTAGIYLQAKSACGGSEPPYFVDDGQLYKICRESGVVPNPEYLGES